MEGTIWLLGVCQGWHPLRWLSDWGYNFLIYHILQELFNGFSAFYGDLTTSMLNWGNRRVEASNPKYAPLKPFWCIFPSQNQQNLRFWLFPELPLTKNWKNIKLHREKVFAKACKSAHIGFWVCRSQCTMLFSIVITLQLTVFMQLKCWFSIVIISNGHHFATDHLHAVQMLIFYHHHLQLPSLCNWPSSGVCSLYNIPSVGVKGTSSVLWSSANFCSISQNMHYKAPVASQHRKANKVVWTWKDVWTPWRTSTYERPFTQVGNYLVPIFVHCFYIQNGIYFMMPVMLDAI